MNVLALLLLSLPGLSQPLRPNIIVVLTDDQRWDTLSPEIMPELNRRFIDHGVLFSNAFVTNPVCCPARAAILSGGHYSHETQVLTNRFENGSAVRFLDTKTIAVLAQRKGYLTCFIGKYLNGLAELTGVSPDGDPIEPLHYTPPGWNLFAADPDSYDWFHYFIVLGASGTDGPQRGIYLPREVNELDEFLARGDFGDHTRRYLSELDYDDLPYISHFYRGSAENFILDAVERDRPFLVFIGTRAPHAPATPEPQYAQLFPDFTYRGRAWGEADLSDKPGYVRRRAEGFEGEYEGEPTFDDFAADQLRSLRSVDDVLGRLSDLIDSDENLKNNTWMFFLSDNGFLWGEHKLFKKRLPYEESIRVPLVVRSPARVPGVNHGIVAADLDTGATVLSLMGYDARALSEGRTLSMDTDRRRLMCESWRILLDEPSWTLLRTNRWKYVYYDTGERELYNLNRDPFERSNVAGRRPRLGGRFAETINEHRGLCVMGEGYNELWEIPAATAGEYYEWGLSALGGEPPYEWSLITDERYIQRPRDEYIDRFPEGLALDRDGTISGVPAERGKFEFTVQVLDQSNTSYRGGPQRHAAFARLVVE